MAPPPCANPVPLRGRPPGHAEALLQGCRGRAGARRREQALRRCTGPTARLPHRNAFSSLPFTSVRVALVAISHLGFSVLRTCCVCIGHLYSH
jgi:hypothetical protein